jgi:hypothetical protein
MWNFDQKLNEMEACSMGAKGKRGVKFQLYNRVLLNCVIRVITSPTVWNVRFRWAGKDQYIDVNIRPTTDMGIRDYQPRVGDRIQVRGSLIDVSECHHPQFVIVGSEIVYVGHNDSRRRKDYAALSAEWKD